MRPFIIITWMTLVSGMTASSQQYALTVTVSGISKDKGTLYLSLYNSEKGYPRQPTAAFRLANAPIRNGVSNFHLDNLPPGTYAIACYHDENGNRKLDSNLFGAPTEGTGASNDATGSFGPPKFRDAKFPLNRDTAITIHIRY
jgi:uncharacterized protein (DUF2141 family)